MKYPLDSTPYQADLRSEPIYAGIGDGGYVYVRDATGTIQILPDGPHLHPKVLGGGLTAMYAGDMTVCGGRVIDLTNLSGTFQFDEESGLLEVADELRRIGLTVVVGAVRFFPTDGSKPVVLE